MPRLPKLTADLVLLHAPAVFDFRNRNDIYFPYLGTSGDVPITPLYEYFPLGFKALQSSLGQRGYSVRIVNLSSLLIRYPKLSLATIAESLDTKVLGIDLHWMIHVQGSLEVSRQIRALRPDIRILFGGISSTYYARELIAYDHVDLVMRGYDTLQPMEALLRCLATGQNLSNVPNLVWKDDRGVQVNAFSYVPDTYDCSIDWSRLPPPPPGRKGLPISEILSTQNAGCSFNCGWCGGSREAFRRIYPRHRAMARKPKEHVEREWATIKMEPQHRQLHYYALGSYNETDKNLAAFIGHVAGSDVKSISYEQFHLTPEPLLQRMVQANRATSITLSPESHDRGIAKLCGRGVYSNDEMERWIEKALAIGIAQVDIWYFCGMPGQTKESVFETAAYCRKLLKKFQGKRVNPMICPMIPFLDPASTFFEQPDAHGYRLFYKTVREHENGMKRASLINRMNYETRYMSREEIVLVGFEATKMVMEAKGEFGFMPSKFLERHVDKIRDAIEFTKEVHAADSLECPADRRKAISGLGDEILRRNKDIIFSGVANQAFPLNREIGGRWFDEFGWDFDALDKASRED